MFTIPIGFSSSPNYQPSGVVDTTGTGGSVTNSSSAYDGNSSTYAQWWVYVPNSPLTTYSVYSFTGSTVLKSVKLNILVNSVSQAYAGGGIFYMSIDGGSSYPYSASISYGGFGDVNTVLSIPIPDGTVLSSVKVKANPTVSNGIAYNLLADEIYIQ